MGSLSGAWRMRALRKAEGRKKLAFWHRKRLRLSGCMLVSGRLSSKDPLGSFHKLA